MNNGKTREQIYTALFTKLQGAAGFRTFSRRMKLWDDVPDTDKPALILFEPAETMRQGSEATPDLNVFEPLVIIYIAEGKNPASVPISTLNNLIDAVDAALAPASPLYQNQTLGNTVSHCWIEGKITKVAGDIDGDGFAMIPLKILVT